MKPRHQFYLDEPIQEQLEQLAAQPGTTRSAIVNAALKSYFAHRGASELERMFRLRLERMSECLDRLERNQHISLESFALFVRYELGMTPQLPAPEQAAAQAIGRDRFQQFIEQVSRRMAGDKRISEDIIGRVARVAVEESQKVAAE
jgi:hypothetical protein